MKCRIQGALALCLAAGLASAAQPVALDWSELRPAEVAEVNPFSELSDAQLVALGDIVLSRTLEARGQVQGPEARARRAELVARLASEGLDADALLQQREQLMAQRRSIAETPVAALQGRRVQLTGYLVPASADGRSVTEYLLVPWAGACSHTPQPPMNQIVRVSVSGQGMAAVDGNVIVSVTGTLDVQPSEQGLVLADGALIVRSAYSMTSATVGILTPRASAPP